MGSKQLRLQCMESGRAFSIEPASDVRTVRNRASLARGARARDILLHDGKKFLSDEHDLDETTDALYVIKKNNNNDNDVIGSRKEEEDDDPAYYSSSSLDIELLKERIEQRALGFAEGIKKRDQSLSFPKQSPEF